MFFFNEDIHVDELYHTGMYYVGRDNGAPFTGYLIVLGYSINNFSQILVQQTGVQTPRMVIRSRSSGGRISNWFEQGSRHISGGATATDGFTRGTVLCIMSGNVVTISGVVSGTFGTSFANSRVLELDDTIKPRGIYYGTGTFTTTGNIPVGVATARVNGNRYVEIIGQNEHIGSAHFNIQYQID